MQKKLYTAIAAALLLSTGGGGYQLSAEPLTTLQQQTDICKGIVLDKDGEPLIGASVRVEGTTVGTTTDLDGAFSIKGVKKGATVTVTCIGYASESKTWDGAELYFTLSDDQQLLDEVVVVGYGIQKKANVTGAVSSMKAADIEDRAVASISAAMAGEMPGVVVVQQSGAPGSQTGNITVRGNNTINSASPLVIVDGVPGSMNNIDPQDVESISVLKDAASAAIYGVQAANGVILITTKKGKLNTAPVISYSGSVSFTNVTTHLDPVNARDYTMLYREALLNGNPNADVSSWDAKLAQYDNGTLDPAGTNWWNETFKSHGTETAHTVQVNGGSATTTYMASLGYIYQGGLLDQTNYNRYNARVNLDTQLKSWVKFGINTSFYRGISRDGYTGYSGILQHAQRLNATDAVYTADGGFAAPNGFQNPVAERDNRTGIYKSVADQLFTNFYLDITPIEGLSIRPLFSWRHDTTDQYAQKHILEYDGGTNNGDNGTRSGYHNYFNYNWMTYQAVANYNKTFAGKHNLALLAGYEAQRYMIRVSKLTRTGGGDNALDQVLGSLSTNGMGNEDYGYDLVRRSWFGRVQYDFDTRYLFEANFRADASSRFPKDSRWGYFPAVSAGWRISQESFMENTRDWLSQLKLRLGWGRTGNEEFDNDTYYPAVASYAYDNIIIGQGLYNALYEGLYVNNRLKWATVTNLELGIEAGLFDNRLTFEGSIYKKKTDGMLLQLPVQSALGVDAPYQNAGNVENKGIDLTLGYRDQINKDWSYNITVNAGYNHNEITNLAGTSPNIDKEFVFMEGYPVTAYYGYVADGLFKNQEELAKGPVRTGTEKPGDIRYKDLDGDGKITVEDRTVIGKTMPSWMGGVNVGVNFRDFDFSMLWQGAFDYERYMTAEATQAFYNSGGINKWQMEQRWSESNPNGTYPRLYTNFGGSPNAVVSSYWMEDASYVRLKNLTLGYTLPIALTEKIGVSKLRVYFNGENLLTFSDLFDKGIDPEAPAGRGAYYANVRKLSLGLKATF